MNGLERVLDCVTAARFDRYDFPDAFHDCFRGANVGFLDVVRLELRGQAPLSQLLVQVSVELE